MVGEAKDANAFLFLQPTGAFSIIFFLFHMLTTIEFDGKF